MMIQLELPGTQATSYISFFYLTEEERLHCSPAGYCNSSSTCKFGNTAWGFWWPCNIRGLWPPRSPDLTPWDFYLWRTLKDKVYKKSSHTRRTTKHPQITAISGEGLQSVLQVHWVHLVRGEHLASAAAPASFYYVSEGYSYCDSLPLRCAGCVCSCCLLRNSKWFYL
jgi:hypothetical protein